MDFEQPPGRMGALPASPWGYIRPAHRTFAVVKWRSAFVDRLVGACAPPALVRGYRAGIAGRCLFAPFAGLWFLLFGLAQPPGLATLTGAFATVAARTVQKSPSLFAGWLVEFCGTGLGSAVLSTFVRWLDTCLFCISGSR